MIGIVQLFTCKQYKSIASFNLFDAADLGWAQEHNTISLKDTVCKQTVACHEIGRVIEHSRRAFFACTDRLGVPAVKQETCIFRTILCRFIVVRRTADDGERTLTVQEKPRLYFGFEPHDNGQHEGD